MKRTIWRLPAGPIVLASSSPRRRLLLREQGVPFRVAPQNVDESWDGEGPEAFARRLALEKAEAAAARRPRAWCLGADTVVALDGRVLGKPGSRAEARRMLRFLSGRTHRVVSGVALVGPGFRAARVVTTRVRFRRLGAAEIARYAASGEPDDRAGAYAAQGLGATLVAAIEGDWFNVVGLPLGAARELLGAAAGRPRRG
jgi:septum formation protein